SGGVWPGLSALDKNGHSQIHQKWWTSAAISGLKSRVPENVGLAGGPKTLIHVWGRESWAPLKRAGGFGSNTHPRYKWARKYINWWTSAAISGLKSGPGWDYLVDPKPNRSTRCGRESWAPLSVPATDPFTLFVRRLWVDSEDNSMLDPMQKIELKDS
ncbi:hypothetical protein HAX54_040748, partial [Datura stramonium]|nr:hypothetical protein [Datura stramonium]